MQITFEVQGVKEISRNLRLVTSALQNLGGFYSEAIDIVKKRSDDIFSSAGNIVEKGPKRRPLSATTIMARQKRQGYYKKTPISGAGPLVWTGNLKNNVTKQATNSFGMLRYDEPYAKYHQSGGGTLPQRKIIDLDNRTATEIVKALQREIQKQAPIFMRQI